MMMTQQLYVITGQPVSIESAKTFSTIPVAEPSSNNNSIGGGLALLAALDQFSVNPVVDTWLDTPLCLLPKQFLLMTPEKKICYKICEDSDISCRIFCPLSRNFNMLVQDSTGNLAFSIKRKRPMLPCYSSCLYLSCPSKTQQISVELTSGVVLGHIIEEPHCLSNVFLATDPSFAKLLKIVGPSCIPCNCTICCQDITFQIYDEEDREIGDIKFQWTGFKMRIFVAPSDPYIVNFNSQPDVRLKALVIGAIFLIDFRYFEAGRLRKFGTSNALACGLHNFDENQTSSRL